MVSTCLCAYVGHLYSLQSNEIQPCWMIVCLLEFCFVLIEKMKFNGFTSILLDWFKLNYFLFSSVPSIFPDISNRKIIWKVLHVLRNFELFYWKHLQSSRMNDPHNKQKIDFSFLFMICHPIKIIINWNLRKCHSQMTKTHLESSINLNKTCFSVKMPF